MAREQWVTTSPGRHLRGRRKLDTEPELLLRRALHAEGARFRIHRRMAPRCTPDLVLPSRRLAVFVDGCWWHSCPEHGRKTPFTGPNAVLWEAKMRRVRERDRDGTATAQQLGWTVVRLWECEVTADPGAAARLVLGTVDVPASPAGTRVRMRHDTMYAVPERDILGWLRRQCQEYRYDLRGVLRSGGTGEWPLTAVDGEELEAKLVAGGHLLPLPQEPAALAKVLEASILTFLFERAHATGGELAARGGGERRYPDLEISGPGTGGRPYAVDVKVARRGVTKSGRPTGKTQSRLTLYTGDTYFRHPECRWPGMFRPFSDYAQHLDVLGIYTLDRDAAARVTDLELVVQEAWRIGSRQRSSPTRAHIGAVVDLADLRAGRGEFETADEFYRYWRQYDFGAGDVAAERLEKLTKQRE